MLAIQAREYSEISRTTYDEMSSVAVSSQEETFTQNTSTQVAATEAGGVLLSMLTVLMLVLLIVEFIIGEITSISVELPSIHPGTASSHSPGFASGLGWSLTQSDLLASQLHGTPGLLLVLLSLVLLSLVLISLAIARRQRAWVITSITGSVGLILATLSWIDYYTLRIMLK